MMAGTAATKVVKRDIRTLVERRARLLRVRQLKSGARRRQDE